MIMRRRIDEEPGADGTPGGPGSRGLGARAAGWARRLTGGRPHLLVVLSALGVSAGAWVLAYLVRFEFEVPPHHRSLMGLTLPFVLLVHAVAFHASGVFRILWPYVGIRDGLLIVRGTAGATALLYALNGLLLIPGTVPRSVVLLGGVLTLVGVGGLYAALRLAREASVRVEPGRAGPEPVLILGAGDTGDALLREIERSPAPAARVVGFLDDDPDKRGCLLRGVPVVGGRDEAGRLARERSVRQVWVALPSADRTALHRAARSLREAGLLPRVLPPLGRLCTTMPLLPQLRELAIGELLRREPIELEEGRIGTFLRGKRVLVTGAAGSIGSELCRKVLAYHPARLAAFDCAETPLHDLMLELRTGPAEHAVFPELGDVTDPVRVRGLFSAHSPEVVFHAAALKHVPLCESHPREAIRVNVGGTAAVAELAARSGAGHFVLISTDKAVNPSSVMGATKRVAELVVQDFAGTPGPTRFVAVRFGNVLGSNGSVLRIFQSQLARGGPLTVTHPDMRRFFMTIPEAAELVLQAAIQAEGGEVFELDMGPPVRIVDLAEEFIRLSGLVPGRDATIEFTGVRPGEKLFEELYGHAEAVTPTAHPKVLRLKSTRHADDEAAFRLCLERLGPLDPGGDPVVAGLRDGFLRLREPMPREAVVLG